MHSIKCFGNWIYYEDNPYGSGASEKILLRDPITERLGIFKFPKNFTDKDGNQLGVTGEYWAEKLAAAIAERLGIPCAEVDIGVYNGRLGSMSYVFTQEELILIEGIQLILHKYPEYDPDRFVTKKGDAIYSVQMILDSLLDKTIKDIESILNIIVFDCLIGNSDRHHSNWGLLVNFDPVNSCIAPLYDNGSSLCSYVHNPLDYLKDKMRLNSLIDTKSKSRIGWENQKKPRHFDLLRNISRKYFQYIGEIITSIQENLNAIVIEEIIEEFSDEIINADMKKLLIVYLNGKRERILKIYEEEDAKR